MSRNAVAENGIARRGCRQQDDARGIVVLDDVAVTCAGTSNRVSRGVIDTDSGAAVGGNQVVPDDVVVGAGSDLHTGAVVGDDVASVRSAADGVAWRRDDVDADSAISERRRPIGRGANEIALNHVAGRGRADDGQCVQCVAGDHVAGATRRPPDRVVRRVEDEHATLNPLVRHRDGSRDVGSDEVALHDVAGARRVLNGDAAAQVARDDVPRRGCGSADRVPGRQDHDAVVVSSRRSSGGIDAYPVTFDAVVGAALHDDAVAVEPVEDQAANDAVAGGDDQAVCARSRPRTGELDDRRPGETGLRRAVDRDRTGDRR